MYAMLDRKRQTLCAATCEKLERLVTDAKKTHNETVVYQAALIEAARFNSSDNLAKCVLLLQDLM